MTKEEEGRIEYVAGEFLQMVAMLKDGNFDLSGIQFDDKLMHYILSDQFILENHKIKVEQSMQANILTRCIELLKERYSDFYSPEHLQKVIDLRNYYFIKIGGTPFVLAKFIFYKNGDLFMEVSSSQENIVAIDENNFFLLKRENSSNRVFAVHFHIVNNKFEIVNAFHNVCTDLSPILDKKSKVKFGNLVCWNTFTEGGVNGEKSVLYNYKGATIVVPEFTDAKYDYGNFTADRDDLIRIVNRIGDEGKFIDLEFLIDEDGKLATDVWDFSNDIRYSIEGRGEEQEAVLSSIFNEANKKLIQKNAVKKKEKKMGS